MARFNKRKLSAEHYDARRKRLRDNGVKPIPLEAYRIDHHRADEGWRERKCYSVNGKQYRGAKGKTKLMRGPSAPKM